jgi:large subunit ribosomal protein L24
MKIKKGDTVLIISGKDRKKTGKVLNVFPKEQRIIIEGINMRKKHVKPKKSGEKGQVVLVPSPVSASNVKLICPKCGKPARVGYKIVADKKYRMCKKCKSEL